MAERRNVAISQPATGEEEWRALREPLTSGWLAQGPQVAAFEQAFAQRCGVGHAVACSSGTTGLHLALAALGVGPGDEVIVPAFTWIATANAVLYCGATPVFCDVDRVSFNIDPSKVGALVTARTRALVAVHLFGLCADMDALTAAAPEVPLIEDAACAAGATYQGRIAGAMGLAGVFSFHPRKTITTGEGGMLTSDDAQLIERARSLRNHGATAGDELGPHAMPEYNLLGFNYRMTDLQAAIGNVQLRKLDAMLQARDRGAAYYQRELADLQWLRTPTVPSGFTHGWQAYVCWVDEAQAPRSRNAIMQALEQRGVGTRPGTHAVHSLGLYRERLGLNADDFPAARDCERFSMAIPLHNRMSDDDYAYVVEALHAL
jgi:dTDP-4-amino-4,6-dideoxygalactose transaminase